MKIDLSGITVVTGENCPSCIKLINMMDKIKANYRIKTQEELAMMKIKSIPTILKDGAYILDDNGNPIFGCPGSKKDLKEILKR